MAHFKPKKSSHEREIINIWHVYNSTNSGTLASSPFTFISPILEFLDLLSAAHPHIHCRCIREFTFMNPFVYYFNYCNDPTALGFWEQSGDMWEVCHSKHGSVVMLLEWMASSARVVIQTPSHLGASTSQPYPFLAEVSSQSCIMHLLHVLLDFSLGMFEQVSLALRRQSRRRKWERKHEIMNRGEWVSSWRL